MSKKSEVEVEVNGGELQSALAAAKSKLDWTDHSEPPCYHALVRDGYYRVEPAALGDTMTWKVGFITYGGERRSIGDWQDTPKTAKDLAQVDYIKTGGDPAALDPHPMIEVDEVEDTDTEFENLDDSIKDLLDEYDELEVLKALSINIELNAGYKGECEGRDKSDRLASAALHLALENVLAEMRKARPALADMVDVSGI